MAPYLAFGLSWFSYLFVKKGHLRTIFHFLLLIFGFIIFIGAGVLAIAPSPDYVPAWGVIAIGLLFPLVIGYFMNEKKRKVNRLVK
jgi:hypothetical protein